MSGFEIVGVVLAAFPLVLSAIDGYGKGLQHLDTIWRYDKKLKVFERQIQREHQRYRNNLEDLLEPLIDAEKLEMLLDNPRDSAWGAPALHEEVRRRLSRSYETYMSTMEDYHEVLSDLENCLGHSKERVSLGVKSNQVGLVRIDIIHGIVLMRCFRSKEQLPVHLARFGNIQVAEFDMH